MRKRAEPCRAHLPRPGELTFDMLTYRYQLVDGYGGYACLRVAFLAAQQDTSLYQHHLQRAVALERAEFGKTSTTSTIA